MGDFFNSVSLNDLLRLIVLCFFRPWLPEIPKSKKKRKGKRKVKKEANKSTNLLRQSTRREVVNNLTKRPAPGLKPKTL